MLGAFIDMFNEELTATEMLTSGVEVSVTGLFLALMSLSFGNVNAS